MQHHFHGELLLGGARLRELDGKIEGSSNDRDSGWSGEFRIDPASVYMVEIGRPYLLMLDDGRTGHVEVTKVTSVSKGQSIVQFAPAGTESD